MRYENPPTAADIVIEVYIKNEFKGIVLIERGNEPYKGKWALPGGFQEIGESLETTAIRETKEETGLDIIILEQIKMYSNPDRDPRGHVNSIGYIAKAEGIPKAGDDAAKAKIFKLDELPELAFDHEKRIEEYKKWKHQKY